MEWEFIAPMVVSITLILSIAGVMIFRPLAKRLGDLLHEMRKERQESLDHGDLTRLTTLIEQLMDRMERLEERQDFAERVLEKSTESRGSAHSEQTSRRS